MTIYRNLRNRPLYHKLILLASAGLIISSGVYVGYWLISKPIILKIIGIYDPVGTFNQEDGITMNSAYFSWDGDTKFITQELNKANVGQRSFLATIEPWPKDDQDSLAQDLFVDIIDGKYDQVIDNVCSTLAVSKTPVYIRWGHEMEQSNSRYPWANGNPQLYINSYQYFVDRCRTKSNSFVFVWSPAGDKKLNEYWPGNKYVDVIGLSVYNYSLWEQKNIGYVPSFNQLFLPKYSRVKDYKKPILITEMGVTGTDGYKNSWLTSIKSNLHNYRELIGFVYFNSVDTPGAWGNNFPTPDWRISTSSISIFF